MASLEEFSKPLPSPNSWLPNKQLAGFNHMRYHLPNLAVSGVITSMAALRTTFRQLTLVCSSVRAAIALTVNRWASMCMSRIGEDSEGQGGGEGEGGHC